MKDLFGNITRDAIFSHCRKYRYALTRIWDSSKPKVAFIGLNPSTANATTDDNTITKVQKIAHHNGFGGVYMLNLFAIISSDPDYLAQVVDPVGHKNDHFIQLYAEQVNVIVGCWGNFKQAVGRDKEVAQLIGRQLSALHINKNGSPKHPLYCLDNQPIITKPNEHQELHVVRSGGTIDHKH